MSNSIFITYNTGSSVEKNTALRMQTIASLYGISVELPMRPPAKRIKASPESIERISRSNFVLAFCLGNLSKQLQSELHEAVRLNKRIIMLYEDSSKVDFKGYKHVKEVFLDYHNPEAALHEVASYLSPQNNGNKKKSDDNALGVGLVMAGIGLLVFWALNNKDN